MFLFRVANKDFLNSQTYRQCQRKLLKQEISNKKRRARLLRKDLQSVRNDLMSKLKWIDFNHLCNLFLLGNDKALRKHQKIQNKKFGKLSEVSCESVSHDPDKVIYNISSHKLTKEEKSVLFKGLQFPLAPKRLEYADYMLRFELLFRDIKTNDLITAQNSSIKSKLLDTAFTSYNFFERKRPVSNLSEAELNALENLTKNKNLVIQKADKGNTVVIIDKNDYKTKIKNILSDSTKFKKLEFGDNKQLIFLINSEKKRKDIIKPLYQKECLTKKEYDSIYPTGSRPGILYGSAKVHKPIIDNCPSFRPILSAIGTPTYNLEKFLIPVLSPLTVNEFTIHDSFSFAEEVVNFDGNCIMACLDVESLFTNIQLDETIENCINDVFANNDTVHNFIKEDLKELLKFASYESFFTFDNEYYGQLDGVAIGSPLGPTLAKVFRKTVAF